ncbi:chemotaxis protein CheW [Lichenifustis flavocetrariae]|uniref:Chemotaxis protein CheW n=1 Tax=Lichenifustis flavocetrariae TaxID=2949735 RepID=A0AA41Z1P5_9HYPH|nr:chemotaxis protein CheW [Lichenifustis flavocetrariae]MCW6507647.1 chemotaxis protein CheW [Lichenifustis flavocetrariae]
MPDLTQYLTLGLDQDLFGIDIQHVHEILDMRPISGLPQAPAFLLGMIDVRGAGYPVVDLRLKLGLPRAAPTPLTRIVILNVAIGGRHTGVGFVADRVLEVTTFDDARLEPAPEVGGRWRSDYIAGIGRRNGGFVVVFDIERLMSADGNVLAASVKAAAA